MATIKSYTDLEQSRKLAKILPIETADMGYNVFVDNSVRILPIDDWDLTKDGVNGVKTYPAWSLAALVDILTENKICHCDDGYYCQFMSEGDEFPIYSTAEYDNPIDACVEMILKLHEKGLL